MLLRKLYGLDHNGVVPFCLWRIFEAYSKRAMEAPDGKGLFTTMHYFGEGQRYFVGDLTKVINANLKQAGENLSLSSREVGAIMNSLGFTDRHRTNAGWQLCIGPKEQEQVHALVAAYHIDLPPVFSMKEFRKSCAFCQQFPIQ